MKQFIATKAFIEHDGKVLVLRESGKYIDGTNVGKYDVPGGRLNVGERFDEALLREVKEETGLVVTLGKPFFVSEWRPKVKGEDWQVVGISIIVHATSNQVSLSADHDDAKWIDPKHYKEAGVIENFHAAFEAYLAAKK